MPKKPKSAFTWRPLGLEDISRIADWFWDAEDVALFDRTMPVPVNIESMRERWRASLEYSAMPRAYWFLAENEDGVPAGITGLDGINYIQGDAVLPAFVAEDFRGMGLSTAMSVPLIDLAFQKLGLHRLTTFFRDDNTATRGALAKVHFKEEGRFREAWYADGVRHDTIIVGLLASEWAAARDAVIADMAETVKVSLETRGRNPNRD